MSWRRKLRPNPVRDALVPDWFAKAKREGADDAALRARARASCKETLAWRAAQQNEPAPTGEPDEDWVGLMLDMYEAAWSENGDDA